MIDATKLLRHYDEGRITGLDLTIRLCQAAAEQSPKRLAEVLPADVLAEIRGRAATPPESPEGCGIFTSNGWDESGGVESRRLFDGLRR